LRSAASNARSAAARAGAAPIDTPAPTATSVAGPISGSAGAFKPPRKPIVLSPGEGGLQSAAAAAHAKPTVSSPTANRAGIATISMPTASALLKAKQPLAVLAVAVAASSTSAADASAIALSADFAIDVVDAIAVTERGLTALADAAQSNSPADEIATMTAGISESVSAIVVRVSHIIDRFFD
jgi:hypothetical protein